LDELKTAVQRFLKNLKELRESSWREWEEQKAQDKWVMDLIVEWMAELKWALLEATGSN
jgi:hypothetical protein